MINIQRNISLSEYTTFKIGGPAKYFCEINNKKELVKAIDFAKGKDLPFFVLGGGSNLLVSDSGFNGLVISINNKELEINNNKITAGAGVKLANLVSFSINNNLTGLEWAVGIPGTVGGAARVNAHAFNSEMSDLVKKIEKINNIIFSVELELESGNKEKSKELVKEYINKRKNSQPLEFPSAGCVFSNPENGFAGQLVDKCGLKGKRIGDAIVSEKHANFIVNLNNAKSKDVAELINLIKQKVKDRFNLELEEEIEYLDF